MKDYTIDYATGNIRAFNVMGYAEAIAEATKAGYEIDSNTALRVGPNQYQVKLITNALVEEMAAKQLEEERVQREKAEAERQQKEQERLEREAGEAQTQGEVEENDEVDITLDETKETESGGEDTPEPETVTPDSPPSVRKKGRGRPPKNQNS